MIQIQSLLPKIKKISIIKIKALIEKEQKITTMVVEDMGVTSARAVKIIILIIIKMTKINNQIQKVVKVLFSCIIIQKVKVPMVNL